MEFSKLARASLLTIISAQEPDLPSAEKTAEQTPIRHAEVILDRAHQAQSDQPKLQFAYKLEGLELEVRLRLTWPI